MIIPVLELITLHFGKGHVSELNNLNNRPYICLMHPYPPSHQEKSFEVIIPVLEHDKLHFGSGRVSVLKIMIKIAISHGPRAIKPRLLWKRTKKSRLK